MLSRTALGVSVGLAGLLVVGVIVLGKLVGSAGDPESPVALVSVDAPQAGSAACATLIGALPAELTSGSAVLHRLPLASPAPPATMAWGTGGSAEPVVLRCGLNRPPELTPTAQLREISGVRWLPVPGARATTWYLADRAVFVALTVPDGAGTGVLQGVSETVGRNLAASP
ncbi:MAG TPA: DUF3515 domain-containing protein [Actinophytocola sp.]|uniref:DUF3515 domain-containing protein n=1 Tax=Actinophytocola sp. TaxID=1872138 RepID=UPI002DBFAC9A|nr:DUF3515 domain-containing protein [Actinophytocola sp.]HEU5469043.1 DUF3515 domain-containing protein [Actinophytocola sp.]